MAPVADSFAIVFADMDPSIWRNGERALGGNAAVFNLYMRIIFLTNKWRKFAAERRHTAALGGDLFRRLCRKEDILFRKHEFRMDISTSGWLEQVQNHGICAA